MCVCGRVLRGFVPARTTRLRSGSCIAPHINKFQAGPGGHESPPLRTFPHEGATFHDAWRPRVAAACSTSRVSLQMSPSVHRSVDKLVQRLRERARAGQPFDIAA